VVATDIQSKLDQFNEFFSIEHTFNINVSVVETEANEALTFEQFEKNIPLPFKIASEVVNLDQASLKPLQGISGVASQLVEYLHHQTKKIDLLVGYIISQQDEEQQRFKGIKFGGGGLIFSAKQTFNLGQKIELKIFLLDNTCAVYCIGEVIEIEKKATDVPSNPEEWQHKVVFHLIREGDREVLVRNSLHEQSKQLQTLAQQRNNLR
jgi:hypothetical protein